MSDAIASSSSVKKTKVSKTKAAAPSHPTYGAMIKAAVKHLKDRKGASKQAIFKYIISNYKLGDNAAKINAHLRGALKRGVTGGTLKQAAGTGAAGRFRLPEGPAAPKKAVAKKPKAASAEKKSKSPKKSMKPKAKTAKSPKKAAAKPKKVAKSPKKAAAKPKKATKSPKKAAPKAKKAVKA